MGPVLPGRSVSDWGGRSISLAQVVLEHGSATVGFEQYRPVLETVLPLAAEQHRDLAGRPRFEHGELMRWQSNGWSWVPGEVRSASIDGHEPECGTTVATLGAAYLFPMSP